MNPRDDVYNKAIALGVCLLILILFLAATCIHHVVSRISPVGCHGPAAESPASLSALAAGTESATLSARAEIARPSMAWVWGKALALAKGLASVEASPRFSGRATARVFSPFPASGGINVCLAPQNASANGLRTSLEPSYWPLKSGFGGRAAA